MAFATVGHHDDRALREALAAFRGILAAFLWFAIGTVVVALICYGLVTLLTW